jgi:hypothetical protein
MKRTAICIFLCAALILLISGCGKNQDKLSPEEAAIRAITDAAVMEKYELENLEDFQIHAYHAPNGNSYARYQLQLGGYRADDTIEVELDGDGTITNISDTLGKYSVFLDQAKPVDFWWAKFRMTGKRLRYLGETQAYYLTISQEGDLYLSLEIINEFRRPKTDENGDPVGPCGGKHEHLYFAKLVCPAAEK